MGAWDSVAHPGLQLKAPRPTSALPEHRLDALSFVKYTYVSISLNELDGLKLTCKPTEVRANGRCPVHDGQQTIDTLGLDVLSMGECAAILVSYIVICRVIAFLGIRYIKW